MEASTLQAPAGLARTRIAIGTPLLRLRSDDQLVALFRAGHDEAFGVIHERYHKRLLAYARQMLPLRQDAEDALQDVFVRAYSGLRAGDGALALRAWLFRVAHNRCIDELRRPGPPPPEVIALIRCPIQDPIAAAEQRESLRRLIEDVRRLPAQQRSALLMRELGGMSYAELAGVLGISIPALKSLLVRARVGLVQAAQARDTDCGCIRDEIASAYDRGARPNATARRHMRDCSGCRSFRRELRGISRRLSAVAPTAGPLAALAHMLGFSSGAGGSATGAGTVTATGGAATGGATAGAATAGGAGALAGGGAVAVGATSHVATLIAAAVATAGGAVEIQHVAAPSPPAHVRVVAASPAYASPSAAVSAAAGANRTAVSSPVALGPVIKARPAPATGAQRRHHHRRPAALTPIPTTPTDSGTGLTASSTTDSSSGGTLATSCPVAPAPTATPADPATTSPSTESTGTTQCSSSSSTGSSSTTDSGTTSSTSNSSQSSSSSASTTNSSSTSGGSATPSSSSGTSSTSSGSSSTSTSPSSTPPPGSP